MKTTLFLPVLLCSGLVSGRAAAQVSQAWVARYRGPAYSDSEARALVLDSATNVIVTGVSYGEYATVKYDRNGNQVWEARYHGPGLGYNFARAMAIDSADNIYVTGNSFGANNNFDYATVKYDRNGNQLWVARYNGPENTNDFARAIAVDKAGNVYITGTSDSHFIPLDPDGENGSYTTIKYDTNGNQLWVARYAGEDDAGLRDSQAYAIALDSAGKVYVTGYSTGSGTFYDFCTIKYDSDGNQLWLARYDGPAHSRDNCVSLALDSAGNVYVTGGSSGESSHDYATIKYDTDGREIWVTRYQSPGNGWAESYAIKADDRGNVYVTGSAVGVGTGDDMATIKYDGDGNQLWVKRIAGSRGDVALAIALDNAGNVYVAGYSDAGLAFGGDNFETVKYDGNGNQEWEVNYWGPGCVEFGSDVDVASALAVDGNGDVYVTGQTGSCFENGGAYSTLRYTEGSISSRPPTIVDQPLSQTASGGDYVKLNVYAEGTPALSVQWQFKGVNLANATNWFLVFTNVHPADAGDYRVIVSNAFGSATSVVAHLTVLLPCLKSPMLLPDGQFQCTLVGEATRSYTIETSIDLTNWFLLTNFVSATGTNQFTDTAAPNFTRRFYRAVQ